MHNFFLGALTVACIALGLGGYLVFHIHKVVAVLDEAEASAKGEATAMIAYIRKRLSL